MSNPVNELLQDVDLTAVGERLLPNLQYLEDFGFIGLRGAGIQLAGFHASFKTTDSFVPAIELNDRSDTFQGLNSNAKGVGILLSNSF